jgi:cardiolipin synthase
MTLTTTIAIALFIVQLVLIFGFVLLDRRRPSGTLAWLMAVALLPVIGVMLYLVFGLTRIVRQQQRYDAVTQRVTKALEASGVIRRPSTDSEPGAMDRRTGAVVGLGNHLSTTPATGSNECVLLINGPSTYRAMIIAINGAKDHIHIQFYIIQPDATGMALRDRLVGCARRGVKVRVLCDGVGSFGLPSDFWQPLAEAGGEAAIFSPVNVFYRLRRHDRINFRNHRKIVVIDGKVGFTGGINIGQEYLGLNQDIGRWRDTHIMLKGPSALGLQRTFVEDWHWATHKMLDEPRYFPSDLAPNEEGAMVQVVDSGPDREWSPIQRIYVQAIALSNQRVWITSPYFIPGDVMEESLITAALRGIDVRIMLPQRADWRVVSLASKSHYLRLLKAGIQLFEYERGFLHAKSMLIDSWMTTIGSANMDTRSFHLNFESNAFIFDSPFTEEIAQVFLRDLAESTQITLQDELRLGYWPKLLRGLGRLLSPIL